MKLIFLGTSNAISDAARAHTHFVIMGEQRNVLVDCGSDPLLRLQKVGLDHHSLTDLILTHFHPDHVSGAPLLLMNMWLLGRVRPLNIYGLQDTLDRLVIMLENYRWREWQNFFLVTLIRLPTKDMSEILDCDEYRILSSPVQHIIPTIGLRIEDKKYHKYVAYSCDSGPCEQVVHLAWDADVLIHEASGLFEGHSTARQAAEIARQARVKALYLVHFPKGKKTEELIAEASQVFSGEVIVPSDYMQLEI